MSLRILFVSVLLASFVWGAKPKNTGPFKNENEIVAISASVILDREEIKQLVGSDLDGHYILVKVEVTPRFGQEVDVRRDDFLLRTDKDGERSHPFVPSQIAGRGVMVISETAGPSGGGGGIAGPDLGYPGGYPYPGGPLGPSGGGIGVGGSDVTGAQAKVSTGAKEKENPVLKVLEAKILPEKKTDSAVSGLLYFPMEKQKQKDLELIYTTSGGKLSLRFR